MTAYEHIHRVLNCHVNMMYGKYVEYVVHERLTQVADAVCRDVVRFHTNLYHLVGFISYIL